MRGQGRFPRLGAPATGSSRARRSLAQPRPGRSPPRDRSRLLSGRDLVGVRLVGGGSRSGVVRSGLRRGRLGARLTCRSAGGPPHGRSAPRPRRAAPASGRPRPRPWRRRREPRGPDRTAAAAATRLAPPPPPQPQPSAAPALRTCRAQRPAP